MALTSGTRLGPYEILAPLGTGGMGEVYRAKDSRLAREVAIKVLPESAALDSGRLIRFEREARAAGSLNHPHILTVYDIGNHDGTPYVVMELLEGETLREVLLRRSPTVRQVVTWGLAVAQGLFAAHRKGIVHRDVKPENLFLTADGRIKILDFGIAKLLSQSEMDGARSEETTGRASAGSTATSPTQPGALLGTVAYMSPEQVKAEDTDHRSDIFSLGVVLSELLSQEHPFRRGTVTATLIAILQESVSPLGRAGVPPALERIVSRCLEKRPEDRFQSAQDLAQALEGVLEGRSVPATLLSVRERNPYPGLSSFTTADAGSFFGREDEVQAIWEKLRERRMQAVIGPSGAGKTSFVHAGVAASAPEGWAAIVTTPGTTPQRGLGQALGPELARDPEALRRLAGFEDPETALGLLVRWRRAHEEALVVVDQFEEVFTLNEPPAQARFIEFLGRLTSEADVHVLLSLRDDFLMRCPEHKALLPVFGELMPLGSLTQEGLRRAMVEPARRQGYRFEDEALVEEILSAVEGVRGVLPLLAFAVSRLWEKRDQEKKLLTRDAYREIGGVEGALARHAEATLEAIPPEDEELVREIFRNLTTAQGTRSALDREELLSTLPDRERGEAVLRRLVGARLLTSYETEADGTTPAGHRVEIIHESLLKAWPRLLRWQTQDAEGSQLREQLRQAARLWEQRGRKDDLVWTGASFADFCAWRDRYSGGLSSVEQDFAQAMTRVAGRTARRRRVVLAAVAAALGIGVGAFVFARHQAAARLEFSGRAQRLHKSVAEFLLLPQEDLTAISNFLQASEVVTRRQFRLLTNPMLIRHRLVYAFEWLPLVRDRDRGTYEAEAREAGLTTYRFWELGSDGKPRDASRREFYLPIHFMEPPSALALGFDIAADPRRWQIAEKARNTGSVTASPPFLLREEADKPVAQPVVSLYSPVYGEADPESSAKRRERLKGFAMMVFRVAPLVDNAAMTAEAPDLGLVLTDPNSRGAPVLAQRPRRASELPRREGFALDFPVTLADRRWSLSIFVLPGLFVPAWRGAIAPATIGLLAALIALLTPASRGSLRSTRSAFRNRSNSPRRERADD